MTDDEQLDIFNRIIAFLRAKLVPYGYEIYCMTSPSYIWHIVNTSTNSRRPLRFCWHTLSAFFKSDSDSLSFASAISINRSYIVDHVGKDAIGVFDVIARIGDLSTYEEMRIFLDMHG